MRPALDCAESTAQTVYMTTRINGLGFWPMCYKITGKGLELRQVLMLLFVCLWPQYYIPPVRSVLVIYTTPTVVAGV